MTTSIFGTPLCRTSVSRKLACAHQRNFSRHSIATSIPIIANTAPTLANWSCSSSYMKRLRLDRWASQWQPPRNPRLHLQHQTCPFSHETTSSPRLALQQRRYQLQTQWQNQRRHLASRRGAASAAVQAEDVGVETPPVHELSGSFDQTGARSSAIDAAAHIPLNSPSPQRALRSGKLAALHARLSLPAKLPLQTLARCLVDPSVDSRPGYNNAPFAVLGQDLLGLYTSEYLMCHYPRLPVSVLFAAQYAYVGPATLAAMRAEWGVDVVAAPGPEVDPGLLQLKRVTPGKALAQDGIHRVQDLPQDALSGSGRPNDQWNHRRGTSSRVVYDDQFGDLHSGLSSLAESAEGAGSTIVPLETPIETQPTTVEAASASFVRALTGALYLHAGADASQAFHQSHVLSRQLPLHTLFNFTHPTRDLSRLCDREGFEPPVARLISETGRHSRSPVFVVGVFSGNDKLGEGAGSSLNEARVRAAAAALRSWYLYSPPAADIVLPSEVEGVGAEKKVWKPQMVDVGEVVT